MLGWFKRKFGKKSVEPEAVEPELTQEPAEAAVLREVGAEPAVVEPMVDSPAPEAAAVEDELDLAASTSDVPEATAVDLESMVASVEADASVAEAPVEAAVDAAAQSAVAKMVEEPAVAVAEEVPEPEAEALGAAVVEQAEEPALEPAETTAEPLEAEPSESGGVVDERLTEEAGESAEEPVPPGGEESVTPPVDIVAEEILLPEAEAITVGTGTGEEPDGISRAEATVIEQAEEDAQQEASVEDVAAMDAVDTGTDLESVSVEPLIPAAPLVGQNQEKPASKSLFKRLRERLGKTRDSFIYRLDRLFLGKKEIDQDLFEQLEEILITADLGVTTTLELLDGARKKVKRDQLSDPQALKAIIRDQILAYIEASEQPAELVMPEEGPFVIMVVGVNGVGKTTSIGKIAAKFVRAGQSVLLVAGDTFRAAAINQLRIWGERVGVEVIAQNPGADPSSVVFDGLTYGMAHNYDVILIDTAGRLHTSVNLMEELKKIRRVIGKKLPGAPHEVMLVLDATTGQNGISQAKLFHEAVGVTGLTLTKLDGTAKGGIVANVCRETEIPVRFIGIGEQIDDLRDFDAREFVDALFAGQAEG